MLHAGWFRQIREGQLTLSVSDEARERLPEYTEDTIIDVLEKYFTENRVADVVGEVSLYGVELVISDSWSQRIRTMKERNPNFKIPPPLFKRSEHLSDIDFTKLQERIPVAKEQSVRESGGCSAKHCRLGNRECIQYWGCRDTCRVVSTRITSMDACPDRKEAESGSAFFSFSSTD